MRRPSFSSSRFESGRGGGIVASSTFVTTTPYLSDADAAEVTALNVLVTLGYLYYAAVEAHEIRLEGRAYVGSFMNWLQLANLLGYALQARLVQPGGGREEGPTPARW